MARQLAPSVKLSGGARRHGVLEYVGQGPMEKGSTDAQANGGSVRDGLDQAAAGRRSTTAVHP